MQTQRRHTGPNCPTTRSRISNGSQLLQNIDGRSSSARRFKDLVRDFEAEVGGPITAVERSLITQAASLQLRSEQLQSDIVNNKAVDSDQLIRLTGSVRRILATISAKAAKRKPAGGNALAEYKAMRAREKAGGAV